MKKRIVFILMCVCLVSMAQAAVLSYESFSGYTVGSQLDEAIPSPAVAGYTGDWTRVDWGDQQAIVQSGSLAYGTAKGNSIGVGSGFAQSTSGRVYRLLDSTLTVTDSTTGTLYLSWLFRTDNAGPTVYQMLDLYNTNTADANRNFTAGITTNGGQSGTQYNFGADEVYTSTGVAVDTAVHLFVVRFNLSDTAGADSVTVWIDPASEADAGTTVTGKTLVFDRLAFSDYDENSVGWDEVRWGTTFNDVLPAILYNTPTNGATNIAVARTSPANDLVFTVNDSNTTKVDVQFGLENDPNLTAKPAYNIVDDLAVTQGQYTVNLESLAADLSNDKTYYWKVIGYEPNMAPGATDYFAIPGSIWSFTTAPLTATISAVSPAFTVVDAGTDTVLSVTGASIATYQWYKIGDPDVQLTDGADYAGVTTDTLTIKDVQLADEGSYYCVGSNTLPSSDDNRDTPGRIMIKRLTSYYPLEVMNVDVDPNGVTPDVVGGFDMRMTNEAASAGLPVLGTDVAAAALGTYSLVFDNADEATDPNGQFALIADDVAKYVDITIGVWVKYTGGAEWQRIYDIGSTTSSYMFLTPDAGGTGGLRFAITTGSGEQQVNAPALTVGEWTHVAVTIGGDTGRLYVNGELVDTNPGMTLNPIAVTQTLNYVGKSQWADAEFNGLIDDLKIYDYALNSVEVAQDYANVMNVSVCNRLGTADMQFDTNDDCRVDLIDFAELAADWLNDNRIYPQ